MRRADALGDKIAILDKGRLRACGTSLFLKRTYGKGHTISLLSDPAAVDQVKQLVQASMPSAEILGGDAAGSTSVSVKRSAVRGIPRLFSSLMAEDGLITEWGISDTTLEEVFLRLAAQNHEVNASIEGGGDDVGRVQLVRQQEVLCVLEAASPSTIVVVEPTDSGLEVVPLPEDADDPMALEDMDEAVNMEQLVLPVSSASEPTTQMVEVVVPPASQGGQQMEIEVGGQRVAVQLPAGAQPGERVQVPVPLPEVSQSGSDGRTLDDAFANQVSAVGIAKQAYSLLWKNAALAFGCRRAPGFKGCLNCKCCELTFYLSLFIIMALVAIVHTWLVTYMDGQLKAAAAQQACAADPACDDWEEYRGGMYSEFCADGSTNTILERGHGWLPRDAQAGYAYSGSYCPYTHDGACDEPDVCPWGSDTADCGIVGHHSTQFSSCSRIDVAEEMHNLSKRALLPALGQEHRTWISSCNENARNAAGASCWADLVRSSSMFLYSYQNGNNCAQRRISDQEGCTSSDVHSGCAHQNLRNGGIIDFSHGYSDNQCRVWHLSCDSWGNSVTPTLAFTEFDTESGYDWVAVGYDWVAVVHATRQAATHESYQPDDLLVRASGSDLPAPVVGTRATDSWDSGQLTVAFGSDGSVTRRGFVANFTCASEGLQEPQLNPGQESAAPALAPELEPEKEDDNTCLPAAHVWFSDATAPGSTSLAAMSLFPGRPGLTWSQASGSDESHVGDGLSSQGEYGRCRFRGDGECDEPGAGTGLCESGGDYSDCNHVYGVHFTSGIAMQFEAVPAGSVNTRVQEAQRYLRDHTFDTVEAADTFVRDSLPAFAIEVDKSTVRTGAATLHYAVRLWSAHYYNAFAHLRAEVRSPSSGNDTCISARNSLCSDPTDPQFQYWLHSDQYCDPGTDASDCAGPPVCVLKRDVDIVYSGGRGRETKEDIRLRGIISAMSNTVLRTMVGPNATLSTIVVPMPELTWHATGGNEDAVGFWVMCYPLLTMLLVPSLAFMLASEKERGLFEMIRMQGGRADSFFLGNWLFVFAYSLAFSGLFVLTIEFSGAADEPSDVALPAGRVTSLVLAWAIAQTGFVFFVGLVMFARARHAALFCVVSMILSIMCGEIITMLEYNHQLSSTPLPTSCLLFPPFAYSRTAALLLWHGGGEEFERGLWMLWFDGLFLFALSVCHSLWPKGAGRQLWERLREASAATDEPTVVSTGGGKPFRSDDESVIAERERAGRMPDIPAILIQGLVKNYTSVNHGKSVTKRVVNDLFLAVERGEVFGLLGPNGAG